MRVDNMSDSSQNFRMQTPLHNHDPGAPAGPKREFTPAFPLLGLYDPIVRLLSRDHAWRRILLAQIAPLTGELIVDAGCGTGTFLKQIDARAPGVRLVGIDPDVRVLLRARTKLARAGITAELRPGYLRDLTELLPGQQVSKFTCSLVLHQVPLAEKRAGLAAMSAALTPGGEVFIADYGHQRTVLMRLLFRLIQYIDGFDDTQPNADGILPALMRDAGFINVAETAVLPTPTGSVSIYHGTKPAKPCLPG